MLTTENRQRSKSSRGLRMKSPLTMRYKISQQDSSKQKLSLGKSNGSTNDSIQSERRAFAKISDNNTSDKNKGKNWTSTQNFKNKILVSSCEFNRLKQKLQGSSNSQKGSVGPQNKKKNDNKVKVKILDRLSKHSSNTSDKTTSDSTGSTGSQEVQMLKIENEYFKQIYDEALFELSKLKNKLKQEKKVHDVQKQIYQTQINKLKRIVDSDKQQVSHIICDQENRCIIVVSTLDESTDEGMLGLDSDCQDSIADLSIQSK